MAPSSASAASATQANFPLKGGDDGLSHSAAPMATATVASKTSSRTNRRPDSKLLEIMVMGSRFNFEIKRSAQPFDGVIG